ncbi:MAG TPA: hypothetical protein VK747_12675 [Blastocatellia bacterium]|nr:hypothetical protein [Blastocatellia bacterium]
MNWMATRSSDPVRLSSLKVALLSAFSFVALALWLNAGQVCFGQTGEDAKKIVLNKSCGGAHDFEKEGYVVGRTRVEDPFDFLPWVRIKERHAADQIKALLDGKPFVYDTAISQALGIIEKENFLPDTSDLRYSFRVEVVSVENCADHKLDLVYGVYSTQILPVQSGTPEARITERQAPQTAAGMSNVNAPSARPFHLMPSAGFDSEDEMSGGGRVEITRKRMLKMPFDSMVFEGSGSSRMRSVAVAMSGSTDSLGWLAHVDWRLNYANYSLPTGAGNISGGHLSAQVSGMSQAFANGNFTARFGGLLEAGNRQSAITDEKLTSDTIDSAGFGALKLYAGLDSRLSHNVFSVSYGLELGTVKPAGRVDWRKHIGDIKYDFWYPLGEHRMLDLESRFTVGGIQVPGKIPLPMRFFGGNNEEFFIPGESWQIRANPVIRAIPGSRLFRTADGAGADRFFSYNLTAAYTLWREPLVPTELTKDPSFISTLEGSIESIISPQQVYHATKDAHYRKLVAQLLPKVSGALNDLKAAVQKAQNARPGEFTTEFRACTGAINTALRRATSAVQAKDAVQQYGSVAALLPEDEDALARVTNRCVTELNAALGGEAAIAAAGNSIDRIRTDMEAEFQQIDQAAAARAAKADLAFPIRALNTLLNEVNIYSLGPVFVFDVAKIDSKTTGFGGVRYGPGVGLRLELVSMVNFTAGYAWNIRQGPGEGSGNVFFSLGLRDLFH